jgi:hypothetical protein
MEGFYLAIYQYLEAQTPENKLDGMSKILSMAEVLILLVEVTDTNGEQILFS